MANLIITVISIALVAVAALMGAYYGGTAFMDGQTRATANAIIQQAEQIKGAYLMYLASGGTPPASSAAINGSDVLTTGGKYLSAAPIPPSALTMSTGLPGWRFLNIALSPNEVARIAISFKAPRAVCERLAEIYTGEKEMGSLSISDTGTWDLNKDSHNRGLLTRLTTFGGDCFYADLNSNNSFDDGEEFAFHLLLKR